MFRVWRILTASALGGELVESTKDGWSKTTMFCGPQALAVTLPWANASDAPNTKTKHSASASAALSGPSRLGVGIAHLRECRMPYSFREWMVLLGPPVFAWRMQGLVVYVGDVTVIYGIYRHVMCRTGVFASDSPCAATQEGWGRSTK